MNENQMSLLEDLDSQLTGIDSAVGKKLGGTQKSKSKQQNAPDKDEISMMEDDEFFEKKADGKK